jgi:hypothetical protein
MHENLTKLLLVAYKLVQDFLVKMYYKISPHFGIWEEFSKGDGVGQD